MGHDVVKGVQDELVEGGKIGPAVCFDMLYPTTNKPADALAWLDAMDIRNS